MDLSASLVSLPGHLRVGCAFRRAGVIGWLVGGFLLVGPVFGQEGSDTRPAGVSVARRLPAALLDIPRVQPGMTNPQLLDLGFEALDAKQLDEAELLLAFVFREEPDNLEALARLAFTYELRLATALSGGPEEADKADRYKQATVGTYLAAAELARQEKNYVPAEAFLNKVRLYRPTDVAAKLSLARVMGATERTLQAIELYRDYLKSPEGKNDSEAWLELGKLYRGSFKGLAVTTLEEAARLNPDNPAVYLALAKTYLDGGRLAKAVEVADTAVNKAEGAPADWREENLVHEYVNNLAMTLLAADEQDRADRQSQRAVDLARKALNKSPDSVAPLRALVAYYDTRQWVLRSLLADDPENTGRLIKMARAKQEQAEARHALALHDALAWLPETEGTSRDDIKLLEIRAELQYKVHKLEEAAETCRLLLKLDPKNSVALQIQKNLPEAPQAKTTGKNPDSTAPQK